MKYAFRSLAKSPGFSMNVILTLTLAIGANTALFSIFHRLVLSPLDLPQSQRLVRIWASNPDRNFRAPAISAAASRRHASVQSFSLKFLSP